MKSIAPGLVCIVDGDASILRSCKRLMLARGLRAEGFDSPLSYLAWAERYHHREPSCVILDVRMPEDDGLQLQQKLNALAVPVIFLTGYSDVPTCAAAMKAGAVDFLLKPVNEDGLMAAVATALEVSVALRKARQSRQAARARFQHLTKRETQVMSCVIAGMLNKQIRAVLGASEKTIKVHRGRFMEKVGVRSVDRTGVTGRGCRHAAHDHPGGP